MSAESFAATGLPASDGNSGLSRRRFMGYVIAAPTLVTGVRLLDLSPAAAAPAGNPLPSIGPQIAEQYDLIDFLKHAATPTANLITVQVNSDGTVEFDMHRTEVGQGISTAIAMVIAEEMDVPVENVRITLADGRQELLFNQLTGGSNSIYTIYDPVRLAAAVARQRLLDAAAILFQTGAANLSILDGIVRGPDGVSVPIGELAQAAASDLTEPLENVQPKSGDFNVVGKPRNRIDALGMVTGERQYVSDMQIPDALPTMVARPPTIFPPVTGATEPGYTVQSLNNRGVIEGMPGVTDVAVFETGVAIRAQTFGQCIDALQVIDVTWKDGPTAGMSDESVQAALAAAELPQLVPDLDLPLDLPVNTLDREITFAFQPNCPLEPNPAIASFAEGKCEVWGPFKTPAIAQADIALALGLLPTDVTCHVIQAGGSFGRDLFWDAGREAALISKAMGKPVKLGWTRTDDFRQGRAHPANRSSIRAIYTDDSILAFSQNHTSVNTDYGHGLGDIVSATADEFPGGLGGLTFSQSIFFLTQYIPYNFGVVSQLLNETLPAPAILLPDPSAGTEPNVFRTGSMRNIYSPNVVTARELAIDEIVADMVANGADTDPYEFRLEFLKDQRSKDVLEAVATEGQWGRSMPAGTAQGIAFHSEYKGRAACLIEIDTRPETVNRTVPGLASAMTGPRVTKAIYAVDVGLAINPRGLEAQMLGGMMDGIANALTYSLHLVDGGYVEDSWEHAYYTRQWNTPPETKVIILQTSSSPGGAGEFGVAATMAATACAYARATGTRPEHIPINHDAPLAETIVPAGTIPQSPTDGLAEAR